MNFFGFLGTTCGKANKMNSQQGLLVQVRAEMLSPRTTNSVLRIPKNILSTLQRPLKKHIFAGTRVFDLKLTNSGLMYTGIFQSVLRIFLGIMSTLYCWKKEDFSALRLDCSEMPLVPPLKMLCAQWLLPKVPFGSSFYSLFRMLYPGIQKNSRVLAVMYSEYF